MQNLPLPSKEQAIILNDSAACKLVNSCPGSGKTTLLLQAIRQHYAQNNGQCLLISFSKLATEANCLKVKHYFPEYARDIQVQTLHAFCLQVLMQHWKFAGYSNKPTFGKKFDSDLFAKAYSTKLTAEQKKFIPLEDAERIIEKAIATQRRIIVVIKKYEDVKWREHESLFTEIKKQYLLYRKQHGNFHYSEMITECRKLFGEHPELLVQVAGQYKLLLVDEFQDLTNEQMKVVDYLVNTIPDSILVGDDAQSIYQFRGVDTNNFTLLEKNIDCKRFALTKTYRCTKQVAALATQIRNQMPDATALIMKTSKSGNKVSFARFLEEKNQYYYVARKVQELVARDYNYNKIAILARTHTSLSDLQRILQVRKIPFRTKYTEQNFNSEDTNTPICVEELPKLVVAFILLLTDEEYLPHLLVVFSFLNIITTEIHEKYIATEFETNRKKADKEIGFVVEEEKSNLIALGNLIQKSKSMSLESKVSCIVDFILNRFKKSTKYYIKSHLIEVVLLSRNIGDQHNLISAILALHWERNNAVSLLTVHQSKGLEFEYVFIIDADDKRFPHIVKVAALKHTIEDERKLFYVALTRASKAVFCSSKITPPLETEINNIIKPTRYIFTNPGAKKLVNVLRINYSKTKSFVVESGK